MQKQAVLSVVTPLVRQVSLMGSQQLGRVHVLIKVGHYCKDDAQDLNAGGKEDELVYLRRGYEEQGVICTEISGGRDSFLSDQVSKDPRFRHNDHHHVSKGHCQQPCCLTQ